jgi:hypothetical protein
MKDVDPAALEQMPDAAKVDLLAVIERPLRAQEWSSAVPLPQPSLRSFAHSATLV